MSVLNHNSLLGGWYDSLVNLIVFFPYNIMIFKPMILKSTILLLTYFLYCLSCTRSREAWSLETGYTLDGVTVDFRAQKHRHKHTTHNVVLDTPSNSMVFGLASLGWS